MKRFESTYVPDEHSTFIDTLRAEHERQPFLFDSRANLRRISKIAMAQSVSFERIRGVVEAANWSYDSVWLNVRHERDYLIDLSLPLKNHVFVEEMGVYVAESFGKIPPYEEPTKLKEIIRDTDFEERIVATIPDGFNYFGEKFILD